MTSPQQRLDLDRILNTIDTRAAVVILVGDGAELETATKGIDNDLALFEICWSITRQLADVVFKDLPEDTRAKARLVYPTLEQARELGVLRRDGRN